MTPSIPKQLNLRLNVIEEMMRHSLEKPECSKKKLNKNYIYIFFASAMSKLKWSITYIKFNIKKKI